MRYLGRAKVSIDAGAYIDRDGSRDAVLFEPAPRSDTTVAIAIERIDAGMAVEIFHLANGSSIAKLATPESA